MYREMSRLNINIFSPMRLLILYAFTLLLSTHEADSDKGTLTKKMNVVDICKM